MATAQLPAHRFLSLSLVGCLNEAPAVTFITPAQLAAGTGRQSVERDPWWEVHSAGGAQKWKVAAEERAQLRLGLSTAAPKSLDLPPARRLTFQLLAGPGVAECSGSGCANSSLAWPLLPGVCSCSRQELSMRWPVAVFS